MGWTSYHKPVNVSTREALQKELTWNHLPEDERRSIVHAANRGNVHCFAVRYPPAAVAKYNMTRDFQPEKDGSIVSCLVFLTRTDSKDYYNFSYKDMDECMGPNDPGPVSVLKYLSPIIGDSQSAQWARNWRERCLAADRQAKRKRALKDGDIIHLAEPIWFQNGKQDSEFVTVIINKKTYFRSKIHGFLCRLSSEQLSRTA